MAATGVGRFLANTRAADSAWVAAAVVAVAVGEVVVEELVEEVVLPPLPRCRPPARSSHLRSHPNLTPLTARRIRQYHRSRPRITQNTPYSYTL
jgi:hypothetical protein